MECPSNIKVDNMHTFMYMYDNSESCEISGANACKSINAIRMFVFAGVILKEYFGEIISLICYNTAPCFTQREKCLRQNESGDKMLRTTSLCFLSTRMILVHVQSILFEFLSAYSAKTSNHSSHYCRS